MAQGITPLEVPERGIVDRDEHLRPETTLEPLATLAPAFEVDETVTAGDSPGSTTAVPPSSWPRRHGSPPEAEFPDEPDVLPGVAR